MTNRVPFAVSYCLFVSCSKVLCKAIVFIINPPPNRLLWSSESYPGCSEAPFFVLYKPRSNFDQQKYDLGLWS